MATMQGLVICLTVCAKQARIYTLPLNVPLVKARLDRSRLWRFLSITDCKTKLNGSYLHQGHNGVYCYLSSSSNGNGRRVENFNENDEDYINSSTFKDGMKIK